MINLVAVRNNLNDEIESSIADIRLNDEEFRCTLGLAQIIREALDAAIHILGKDDDGSCYVETEHEGRVIRKRIEDNFINLLESYAKEMNALDASETISQLGCLNSEYIKEQKKIMAGKIEAALVCYNIIKEAGGFNND